MKRKDLKAGETYYVSHYRGAYSDLFEQKRTCHVGTFGVKVLAVEPYEYRSYGERHFKVSSGNGVLVEVTEYFTDFDDEKKPFRTTRSFEKVIPLSRIIAPWDIAVKQAKENLVLAEERGRKRAEEKRRQEAYEQNLFAPAIRELTTALTNLHARVDDTPKHYYRDTKLSEMPLDVIETLTVIINEALAEKEEVNA